MLTQTLQSALTHRADAGLLRERYTIHSRVGNTIIIDQKPYINFSGNDYLGIAMHPTVINAFIEGAQHYGLGSSASALVSGFFKPHRMLEEEFAAFVQCERAILFNSGYLANLGVISAFAERGHTIVSDRLAHASILQGIQLSRAKHLRFQHNDVDHAAALLQKCSQPNLLITESVFSMNGDIAPVAQLAAVAKTQGALFMVDDAHGIGVLGQHGRGIIEYANLQKDDLTCLITPLGKAFGSMGALVSGSQAVIETLVQFAKTYCYTTAPPPALAFATLAALKIIAQEKWRREKLREVITFFIKHAQERGLPLVSEDLTPIKSILIGDNKTALKIKNRLMQQGLFVSCIRPPSVPKGSARIKIALNCLHDEGDIERLLDIIGAEYVHPNP